MFTFDLLFEMCASHLSSPLHTHSSEEMEHPELSSAVSPNQPEVVIGGGLRMEQVLEGSRQPHGNYLLVVEL